MAWDLSGNIRGPAGEGQSAVETWEYGPFAEANPSYKAAAKAAGTSGLRTVVLSDSTSDAFSGGRTGAGNQTSTAWKDAWPGRLNRKIRDQLGLPAGGVGWIPPNTPTPPGGYAYRTTLLEPSDWNTIDDLTFNQGIPGSMWLQRGRVEGSAIYIDTVTYNLTPGTTSIDVYISGYGALIEIQTSNGARDYQTAGNGDEKRWITITNPGAQVRFRANSGQGFTMLGLMEYVGDEVAGSKMMNLAIAGVRGEEVYSWLQDPVRAIKQSITRYNPQLAIVVLGSNDIGYGRTPGEVLNILGGITMELKNAVPNINVLLVMRENPDVNYQQLVTLVKQNAASVGASVLDVGLDPRLDLSAAGIYITDNEHYSSAGDEMMAVVMAEHLKVEKTSGALTEAQVQTLISTAISAIPPPASQASNYKITAAVATPAGGAPTAIGPMEYVSGINYPLSGNYVRLPKGTYLISGSVEFNAASSASNGGWVGFNDGESTAPVTYFGASNTLAIAIKTSGAAIVEVTGASGLVSLVAISGSTNASQRAIKTGGQNKLSIVKV